MGAQRLTASDVACWVVKTATPPAALVPGWAPGAVERLDRCVRPSYRLGLVAPGQRCLLWLSGPRQAGVHAVGTVVAAPGDDLTVRLRLLLLPDPAPRADLLATPLVGAEVVRMPAGSNPSYLTAAQLRPVLDHLSAQERSDAGWA